MTQELKLYQNKTRLLIGTAGMALLLVFLIAMVIQGPNPDSVFKAFRSPLIVYGMGILGIAGTLFILRYGINNLRNPKPRVTLSETGAAMDGFAGRFSANWDAFSGFAQHGAANYVLQLKDPAGYIAQLPEGRPRLNAQALADKFGSPFLIETGMLNVDKAQLEAFLSARLPKVGG